MTVYQLRNKIRNLKEQIADCEEEVLSCRYKMELHESVLARVQRDRYQLEEFLYIRRNRIRSMQEKFPHIFCAAGYQEELGSFLEGTEYQQTLQGYEQTEWSIKNHRDALTCREADLRYEIRTKEEEIERLQRKLRQMEQEE